MLEALKAGRVAALQRRRAATIRGCSRCCSSPSARACRCAAWSRTISIAFARGGVHQGVVADVRASRDYSVEDLVRGAAGPPLLVVLDGIEDPHNVGAIVRSVDASGGHGVIRQTRRSASLDSAAVKASAGALMHVPVADVVNIARAIEELKELGRVDRGPGRRRAADLRHAWTCRCPPRSCSAPKARACAGWCASAATWWCRSRWRGHVDSLNVSVAAGVMLFEAVRQRRVKVTEHA